MMIKRLPSRNHRSKGVRVKDVLKICLLLGVCFWLIYQVKHSHDKKREFDEKDSKASVKSQSDDEILKLGRKDLPKLQEVDKNEKHEDEKEDAVEDEENKPREEQKEIRTQVEEDQEEAKHVEEEEEEEEEWEDKENKHIDNRQGANMQGEEASKHDEEEQDEENKTEETEEERRGGEDDETDEQDQERAELEGDHEDEFLDEEKEREGDSDDKENEEEVNGKENEDEGDVKEGEEKDSQVETENSSDDHDNDGDTNAHVAREEHYKADDASSAVSQDNQITITENDEASLENSNENRNILEDGNKSNNIEESNGIQNGMELKSGEGVMAESGDLLNVTTTEEKDHGTRSNNPEYSMLLNAITNLTETATETSNNSFGLSTQIIVLSQQNETETTSVSNHAQNAVVDGATSLEADAALGDSFNNPNPALSENIINSNATVVGEVSSGSLPMEETTDATQNETINSGAESGGTNKTLHSSLTEWTGNVRSSSETNESTTGTGDAHSDRGSSETNESTNGTVDVAREDPIDSSDFSIINDEKESKIDLETLPDIRTNVDPNEDAASE
ncbi:uncharacterized protein DDB_G0283697 isoform X2 [Mangifera indica]|uniref:uncharacterized protein DDB_G0283697 isoform X2 n=1 Tax=Mangifera indica TaxID=29780 RepID=UPI001CFA80F1|nr:uncharacterized protein DDB_G0283697 isoform X2 [Mangifera indica]